MDLNLLKNITIIAFFVVIGVFILVSILAIYVFIRYGRSKSLTLVISLVFAAIFFMATLSTYLILQTIF